MLQRQAILTISVLLHAVSYYCSMVMFLVLEGGKETFNYFCSLTPFSFTVSTIITIHFGTV